MEIFKVYFEHYADGSDDCESFTTLYRWEADADAACREWEGMARSGVVRCASYEALMVR